MVTKIVGAISGILVIVFLIIALLYANSHNLVDARNCVNKSDVEFFTPISINKDKKIEIVCIDGYKYVIYKNVIVQCFCIDMDAPMPIHCK